MSTLAPLLATTVKISAALPGTSGTPTTVTLAWPRSVATPATMGSSMADSSSVAATAAGMDIPAPSTNVPWLELKVERALIITPCRRAYSTARM